jgi:predicted tellurium resistance membrane protein TerC
MIELLSDPNIWIAFLTLTALELVLGIDNIIFISILAGKLLPEQQRRARYIGLGLAMLMRIVLLFSLSWVMGLREERNRKRRCAYNTFYAPSFNQYFIKSN